MQLAPFSTSTRTARRCGRTSAPCSTALARSPGRACSSILPRSCGAGRARAAWLDRLRQRRRHPARQGRGLKRIYGLVAHLAEPIDYKAIDGAPVDLVFLLLSPPDAGADHLKALAAISRVVRHAPTLEKLRGARSPRCADRGADGGR
jgi:hypothetical protein